MKGRDRERREREEKGREDKRREDATLLALKIKEAVLSRGAQGPPEAEKDKDADFLLDSQERRQSC